MIPLPWWPESQLAAAIFGGGIFAFMGIYVILLWADQRHTELGRERIKMGLLFVGCGAVLGIGGLYVLAPVVVGLAGWMIYKVSVAVYSLRKPLQSECIPLYPDIDKDYTPAVREHLKRRYAGKV